MEISRPKRLKTDQDEEDNPTGSSRDVASSSQTTAVVTTEIVASSSQRFRTPVPVEREHFRRSVRNTPCYWVYARFFDFRNFVKLQSLYALDIKENVYLRLPDPTYNVKEFTSAVLGKNLYVVGGSEKGRFQSYVDVFHHNDHNWSKASFTWELKEGAYAVSANGCIYLFGGCRRQDRRYWCEVYQFSEWSRVPLPKALFRVLDEGLSDVFASAFLGKKIILQGYETGLALDVTSNSWTRVSRKLIQGWRMGIEAAVVQNMLITCYDDMDRPQITERSIRAYDPDQDVWLQIEGIDNSFHQHSHMSQFFSVNGKLVIYHMWEPDDLIFSVFEITKSLPRTVRASLLWQSRFPITTIIKEGAGLLQPEVFRNCDFAPSIIEALKPDA